MPGFARVVEAPAPAVLRPALPPPTADDHIGAVLIPQIAGVLHIFRRRFVQQLIGTVDPHRSVLIQRAYLTAFFNLHLLRRDGRLLTRPSPRLPQVQFVP
jgi:hypothetical protein